MTGMKYDLFQKRVERVQILDNIWHKILFLTLIYKSWIITDDVYLISALSKTSVEVDIFFLVYTYFSNTDQPGFTSYLITL